MKKLRLKIKVSYNRTVAIRFHKTDYYKAMAQDIKNLPNKEKEKAKFAGRRMKSVSAGIEFYKSADYTSTWKILLGIFKTRQKMANGFMPHKRTGQLMSILSNPNFLANCYSTVKKKKGAMTLAQETPDKQLKNRKTDQQKYLKMTYKAPNRVSNFIFKITAQLIKEGRYPWGISRRIYIPKPGTKDVKRPITIPPFMDKVLQEGIRRILESIYEPYFEKMNRSFGFRPNKGVHDAIYGLTRAHCWGLSTAIEGDIKSAYDKVNRQKLIQILGEEIGDQKFLGLIKKRLRYMFYDTSKKKYINDKEGIPQGGIDSPYLWNIYMLKFDQFVTEYLKNLTNEKNKKLKTGQYQEKSTGQSLSEQGLSRNRNFTNEYEDGRVLRRNLTKKIKKLKVKDVNLREWKNINKQVDRPIDTPQNIDTERSAKFNLIKQVRLLRHKRNTQATVVQKRFNLKFHYTRYADDWIILGNFDTEMAEKIKQDIKDYLEKELHATLSLEKTLITNIRKKPAKFLGFEFYIRDTYKITRTIRKCPDGSSRIIIGRMNNTRVVVRPDQQRLIDRFFMKNFCNRKGFPIGVPWLSVLETFAIIERYNAIIKGLANYYAEWITYPSTLSRWLYILKYSCLKTLAQKYNTSITRVFKRFGVRTSTQDTIQYKVTLNFGSKGLLTKQWRLITTKQAIDQAIALNRQREVSKIFEAIENGNYLENYEYPQKEGRTPRVMDKNFLERINWVSRRTQALLGLPCTLCGSSDNVEMHHINHVRKVSYNELDAQKPWLKLLSLRNRKQIPVCFDCHRYIIHGGKYTGPSLSSIAPITMDTKEGKIIKVFDGRQVNIENYVKPGLFYGAKTLEEKGWTPTNNKDNLLDK